MKKNILIEKRLWKWANDLFPICRSITGEGTRFSLDYIKNILPELKIFQIKSGTKVFDWKIPDEWLIKNAYIMNSKGKKLIDFKKNNLHVLGYSTPISKTINYRKLEKHLYSLPKFPSAIPYVTSYYERRWGFCLSHRQKLRLKKEKKSLRILIDSKLFKGYMNYGELIIKGKSKKEIFISTYICHPSLANNEISGPIVTTALAEWLNNLKNNYYTYRIVFIPETIGSIAYISKNLKKLKKEVKAAFNITCVGDNKSYSYLESKFKNTLSDRSALKAYETLKIKYKKYSFLNDRGSDERQYSSPGVDLPFCSMMRTKYGEYREYHTSKDNLSFISSKGLLGGYEAIKTAIEILELNKKYIALNKCEPQFSKRNLKSSLGGSVLNKDYKILSNILSYADGKNDVIELSNILKENIFLINKSIKTLLKFKLLKVAK
tara:strand:+ start:537 stop:1838 length:1302 start_codon:yes stop_codon:yes gene_type:complete